jgi:hypothetical protein
MNMSDTVLSTSGDWSVTTDGLQWILRIRRTQKGQPVWQGVSFVRSTKDILARCMREKGCPPEDAAKLLAAISERFSLQQAPEVAAPAKPAVYETAR